MLIVNFICNFSELLSLKLARLIAELGTPRDLLDNKGKFYGMVKDAAVASPIYNDK